MIGSLAESLTVDRHDAADWNRLKEIFASNTLQMVSFTITEKGYSITSPDGAFRADVKADFEAGPEAGSIMLLEIYPGRSSTGTGKYGQLLPQRR